MLEQTRPARAEPVTLVVHRRVFRCVDWVLFAIFSAVDVAVTVWFLNRLVPLIAEASLLLLVIAPGMVGLVAFQARWFSLPLMRRPVPMAPAAGLRVAAVTTFVPGLESLEMLRRTVHAMVAMRYPHDTWVLDEGDTPEVRALCEELGARHFSRRGTPRFQAASGAFTSGTKHGNYNAWLATVGFEGYDVVAGFDPDHVPKPEYLERTLGYLRDPRVGYVQAPQSYYNQPASLIARGAAEETYGYYSSVQMASYALGYPIVTGCHTVQRMTALREVGGFAPHEADDLLITVHYRVAGWRGVYVPEVLAAGITPADWAGYLSQQRRWARSVLDVKLRRFPRLARQLPPVERIVAALHGLYYLHGLSTAGAVAFLSVALAVGLEVPAPGMAALMAAGVLAVTLLGCELFRQRFYLDRRQEWGLHLRAGLLKFAKWPWVLLALVEAVRGQTPAYAVTAKAVSPVRRRVSAPHLVALSVLLAAGGVGAVATTGPSLVVVGLAAAYVAVSVAVIFASRLPPVAPYDDSLAAERVPWSRLNS